MSRILIANYVSRPDLRTLFFHVLCVGLSRLFAFLQTRVGAIKVCYSRPANPRHIVHKKLVVLIEKILYIDPGVRCIRWRVSLCGLSPNLGPIVCEVLAMLSILIPGNLLSKYPS